MKSNDLNTVTEILNCNEITIHEIYDKDGKTFFLCDGIFLIFHHDKKKIIVCFHVGMKPDIAASIGVSLTQIKHEIVFNPLFVYDKDGNIINGEDAEKLFHDNVAQDILHNFIQIQQQLYLLNTIQPTKEHMN